MLPRFFTRPGFSQSSDPLQKTAYCQFAESGLADKPVDTEGISCGNTSVPVSTPLHFMQLHLRFPKGNLQVSSNRCVVRGQRCIRRVSPGENLQISLGWGELNIFLAEVILGVRSSCQERRWAIRFDTISAIVLPLVACPFMIMLDRCIYNCTRRQEIPNLW